MEVTAIGFIVIPLSLLLFVRGARSLFWATVVSAPFFAVRLVWSPLFSSIGTPFMWFGALLLLRQLLDALATGRARLGLPREALWLLAFLATAAVSLIMPVFLRDSVSVVPMETSFVEYTWQPLRFRRTNLTQLAYPLFTTAVFLAIYSQLKSIDQIQRVVRSLVLGTIVVLGSGLFYQLTSAVGATGLRDTVYHLFMGRSLPPLSLAFSSFPRMYSLAGEPGYTAALLTIILGPVILGASRSGTDFPRNRSGAPSFLAPLMVLGLLLTGGTTGMVGLSFFLLALLMVALVASTNRRRAVGRVLRHVWFNTVAGLGIAGLAFVIAITLLSDVSFTEWMFQMHVGKLMAAEDVSGSGVFRLQATLAGFDLALKYPILGVGYGSHRTTTLISSLLANVGIFATAAFLAFNAALVIGCLRIVRRRAHQLSMVAGGLAASMTAFVGAALIAKGMETFLFGYYWVVLATMAATIRLYRRENQRPEQPDSVAGVTET